MKPQYNKTIYACFTGYIVQAIINNFAPLLFLTFHFEYGIPLSRITLLVTLNFALQLIVDLVSISFVDRLGYRFCTILAHILAMAGLFLLTVLPEITPDPFIGLLGAIIIYAAGGGLLEVLISPIVEATPTANKEQAMSLLHSFYCWGHVAVVVLSTVFFHFAGISNWKILACLWAVVPFFNALMFFRVPIAPLLPEHETSLTLKELSGMKIFWLLLLLMFCAGACEQAVSQWASTYAEQGLGVAKTVGDLSGPMMFAILMGTSRAVFGKYGERLNLQRFMMYSGILCIFSYLVISLSGSPVLGLIGCGLCGLSVGIFWPGTFSIGAKAIRRGGTAMFALFALAGDLGCSAGPTLVGMVAGAFNDQLQYGILAAAVFPIVLILGLPAVKTKTD